MNTPKKLFCIIVTLVAMTSFLTAANQTKTNLIRYYQDLCTWMQGEAYQRVINDYDKITAKQDLIAERYGFVDLEKVTEAEEKYAQDPEVVAVLEKYTQLSKHLRVKNNTANTAKITVNYQPTKNKSFKKILTLVKESELLKFLAEHVQSFFFLPKNLTISLEECKEENAYAAHASTNTIK